MTDLAPAVEPVAVYDCTDERWPRIVADEPLHNRFIDWLRSNGIEPNDTRRVEIYIIDCPSARVVQYARDPDGRLYLDCDHLKHTDDCEVAMREPYVVPLTSLPPEGAR